MNPVVSYNKAIESTINYNPWSPPLSSPRRFFTIIGGKMGIFQLCLLILFVLIGSTITPLLMGLSFLTRPAHRYECLKDLKDGGEEWQPCTRDSICNESIPSDRYRAVPDDEYIDNWLSADKYDLLCESKMKIGFIGSSFFLGMISTILILPPLSDKIMGRKWILRIGFILYTTAYIGVVFSYNIYELYVYYFLIGATFSIQVVIGLTYVTELMA